jgi:hypothetical protein
MRVCQLERRALAKLKIAFEEEWQHARVQWRSVIRSAA